MTPEKIYTTVGPCNDEAGIWTTEKMPNDTKYIRSDIVEQMVKDEHTKTTNEFVSGWTKKLVREVVRKKYPMIAGDILDDVVFIANKAIRGE